jgi:hypothetical protein
MKKRKRRQIVRVGRESEREREKREKIMHIKLVW